MPSIRTAVTLCKCNLSALRHAGPIDRRMQQRRDRPGGTDIHQPHSGRSPAQPSAGQNRNPLRHQHLEPT